MKPRFYTAREVAERYCGVKVRVYWNFHKKCWSVVNYETRLVICHSDHVILEGVTSRVSEYGRQRVLKDKRKNVHAWLIGRIVPTFTDKPYKAIGNIGYNPYRHHTFVLVNHPFKWSFEWADYVSFCGSTVEAFNRMVS